MLVSKCFLFGTASVFIIKKKMLLFLSDEFHRNKQLIDKNFNLRESSCWCVDVFIIKVAPLLYVDKFYYGKFPFKERETGTGTR